MQSLLTGYVRRFNKIHRRRGHLFEGRYKAIVCDRDSYLLELVRYIHLNPSQSSQSFAGQTARQVAVERPPRIPGKRKARTDRLWTRHGTTQDRCSL